VSGYDCKTNHPAGFTLTLDYEEDQDVVFVNTYTEKSENSGNNTDGDNSGNGGDLGDGGNGDKPDADGDSQDGDKSGDAGTGSDDNPRENNDDWAGVKIGDFVSDHVWYIRGYEDNTIRPDSPITRAEAAMAFYRLLDPDLKRIDPPSTFNDITAGKWYGAAIGALAYYGVFSGYPDGSFRPDLPITREELAAVVSRFDHLKESGENPFSDVNPDHWAYKSILSATKKGWFVGYGNGMFRPGDSIKRSEFVTVANRVFSRRILPEDIPASLHVFSDFDSSHWSYADFIEAIYTHDFVRKRGGDGINEHWTEIIGDGITAPYNE
jgi:hypothetical protein